MFIQTYIAKQMLIQWPYSILLVNIWKLSENNNNNHNNNDDDDDDDDVVACLSVCLEVFV